jgi:hypothetical protein
MKLFLAAMTSLLLSATVQAKTLEADVDNYVQIFKGDSSLHAEAADTFSWMGLSDPRLFDVIEKDLAQADLSDKGRVGRYIRALGFSGQQKYLPTLQSFANNPTYKRFAMAAIEDQPRYQRWNPIISNRATFDPRYSDDVNRIRNMLQSNDLALEEIGAKRVYFSNKDDVLLDLLAANVKKTYMSTDPSESDSIAWMVKALGSAKNSKYTSLLQEVANNARQSQIRRHASKALD